MSTSASLSMALVCFASLARAGADSDQQNSPNFDATPAQISTYNRMLLTHGILMSLAFVVLFPLGAVFIKALHFKNLFWFHAGWQITAYAISIVGMGFGIWAMWGQNAVDSSSGHPVVGLFILAAILLLPPLGWFHHVAFVHTRTRSVWTYLHRWLGRAAIVVGAIDGGFGLSNTQGRPGWGIPVYAVCAVVFYVLWLGVLLIRNWRQGRREGGAKGDGEDVMLRGFQGRDGDEAAL